ncbi:ABC transporter permease [Mucilaginibacter sp. X4EP1]|uniref:ABC transporter permease n=1 Tax=Mucilaginibacter sp. X4EP1 TaxID=2723092 RepID=UPI002168E1B8|nr:ABC transporter permease [Mucilaginibacter sp. X4EP1]MCS3812755.1 ABC-2 type transport system permease protein [Mucilaginibacter sp. X4EP1]
MSQPLNQVRAAFTLSRYSLLAMFRSPTSIVFSLLFPIIFITVFGSINPGKPLVMKLALVQGSDTTNMVFKAIKRISNISVVTGLSATQLKEDLDKGRITALLDITPDEKPELITHYTVHLQTAGASGESVGLLETEINAAIAQINQKAFPANLSVANVDLTKSKGRVYKSIDFILPGQLGFSLLMAGVYGSSFLLFSLRKNLVLKRLRVAPVKRRTIIAGEMLSHLFFHVISFIIMVMLGFFVFDFTLVNGFATLVEMLSFSLFGLFIFMGIGFIISGVVQNENSIAPIANTIVLPQILLCGLFFPIENYPHWLQQFCNILPLTLFVDGLRKIAFEGTHLVQLPLTIGGLVIWTFVIGWVSVRSFKWE